jgi:hypothetical protein
VSTTEEQLQRKSSGFGLEIRDYGRRDPPLLPRGTLYQQKLSLTSPTSSGRPVDIVRLRTQATEFVFCFVFTEFWKWRVLSGAEGICKEDAADQGVKDIGKIRRKSVLESGALKIEMEGPLEHQQHSLHMHGVANTK